MKVARSLLIVALVMLATTPGAFAKGKPSHSKVRIGTQQTFQEFLKAQSPGQEEIIQCSIYCGGTDQPITTTTFPGTVSGCLADCAEICGSPCEIAN